MIGASTSRRGFAALHPEQLRRLSSRGGMAVAAANRSFSRDRALAAEAGRKGAQMRAARSHGPQPIGAPQRARKEDGEPDKP